MASTSLELRELETHERQVQNTIRHTHTQGVCCRFHISLMVGVHGLCYHFFQDLLVTVFENGELMKEYSFDEIRDRAELPLLRKN